jgi:hypothetical protein
MQVLLNNVDVTSAVQESTYKVDSVEKSTSWTDASFVDHKFAIYHKIQGSFDMVFIPDLTLSYADFLTALGAVTASGVTRISLTVNNLNEELRTIDCFLKIEFEPIRKISNSTKYKRCTVTIQEC